MKTSLFIVFLLVFLISGITITKAQNTVITDNPVYNGDPSAMLDVNAVDKGFLVPRVTTLQMNAIVSPATGLLVFNTDKNCFCYRAENEWVVLSSQLLPLNAGVNEALFHVNNASGDTVFAVYPEGVRINVGDGLTKGSGNKGGFAVGGFSGGKTAVTELMRITNDSARIYVNSNPVKGSGNKGGFAVGGFSDGKEVNGFIFLNPKNYFIGHQSGSKNISGIYNSVLGYKSALNLTTGSWNSFIGYQAGLNNIDGNYNVFIGFNAGYNNTTGDENTYIGYNAGANDTTGFYNVYIGYSSGSGAIQGGPLSSNKNYRNVLIGAYAGDSLFGSSSSTFVGYSAGRYNTSANGNSLFGSEAGMNNKTGNNNTFLGYKAGYSSTSGYNLYAGAFSGYYITNGTRNVFLGYNSGKSMTTGHYNLFSGVESGFNKTNGIGNVLLGYQAGYTDVSGTGDYNVIIGFKAGYNASGDSNIFIGQSAGYNETGTSKLYIDNTNSSNPLVYGEFNNNLLKINGTCHINDILKLTPRTDDPPSGSEGMIYLYKNGSTFKLRVYNGTTWVDL